MRRTLGTLVIILCAVLDTASAALWHQTAGVGGSTPQAVAVHPTEPQIVLAGGRGLFRTEDGGQTWRRITLVREDRRFTYWGIVGIAFSPARPDTAYCVAGDALLAGTLAGRRWRVCSQTQVLERTRALVADQHDPERLYIALNQAPLVPGPSLLISRDGGKTLENSSLPDGLHLCRLHADPHHEGVLLADAIQVDKRQILISRDQGSTWATLPHPSGELADIIVWHNADPSDAAVVHVITRRLGQRALTFWSTNDDGRTWKRSDDEPAGVFPRQISAPALRDYPVESLLLASSDPETIYCVPPVPSPFAIGRSRDAGATWEDIGARIPDAEVSQLRRHPVMKVMQI